MKNYISVESKLISKRTSVSTFESHTSPSTDQSLQKSFHLSHPDKIELKKISSPSENKKYATSQPDPTKTVKRSIDNGSQGRTTRITGYNSTCPKGGFSCFKDSFVVNQSLVLRINPDSYRDGENRHFFKPETVTKKLIKKLQEAKLLKRYFIQFYSYYFSLAILLASLIS